MLAYADSSALVKLAVAEPETAALVDALEAFEAVVSSDLAAVEVTRAARRAAGRAGERAARAVLDRVGLLRIDGAVLRRAAALDPPALRSLDALHVASALEVGDPLTVLAYDERLIAAARAAGLACASPA